MEKTRTLSEDEMIKRYKQGQTLQEIGDAAGISRERVRQLLKRNGVTRNDRPRPQSAKDAAAQVRREDRAQRNYGCSWAEYQEIRGSAPYHESPAGKYTQQRLSAARRGIPWNLTLPQWWGVWQINNAWENRGRNDGEYVMCRFRDQGGYELGNVYLDTCNKNAKYADAKRDNTPPPPREKSGGCRSATARSQKDAHTLSSTEFYDQYVREDSPYSNNPLHLLMREEDG